MSACSIPTFTFHEVDTALDHIIQVAHSGSRDAHYATAFLVSCLNFVGNPTLNLADLPNADRALKRAMAIIIAYLASDNARPLSAFGRNEVIARLALATRCSNRVRPRKHPATSPSTPARP